MRLERKPAAILAATACVLLIIFGAAWPGHGIWLLALSLSLGAIAVVLWYRTAQARAASQERPAPSFSPFADAVSYRRGFGYVPHASGPRRIERPGGISLAGVVAAAAAVALVLYVGGAFSGGGDATPDTNTADADANVIDRSAPDSEFGSTSQTTGGLQASESGVASTAAATEPDAEATTAPLRPIVVKDPGGTTPMSQRSGHYTDSEGADDADDEPAVEARTPERETFTYIVEAGDTLWDIAIRFDVSVSVLADLNGLTSSEIRAGDELAVPEPTE